VLESSLKAIDEQASRDEKDYNNGSFREDKFEERAVKINEIQEKLGQYCKCNMLTLRVRTSPTASSISCTWH
jgi:hypothetical protein